MNTPTTQTGLSLADGEYDDLAETIVEIEREAADAALRAYRIPWIAMMHLEVYISVLVDDGRAYVTPDTLEKMAESIRTSEIGSVDDDAAYADWILAAPESQNGLVDVTDFDALRDDPFWPRTTRLRLARSGSAAAIPSL